MKRLFLILAITALALPATALGKGPSGASISGPGTGGGISFGEGRNSGLFALSEATGLFPAVFPRQPDPMLEERPSGDLGPKYTITWTVPGPENESWKLEQEIYPYATPVPLTYMKPGQAVFRIPGGTRGGWFRADARVKQMLVAKGLPRMAPGATSGSGPFPTGLLAVLAGGMALLAATVLFLRRRMRPAARMAGSAS